MKIHHCFGLLLMILSACQGNTAEEGTSELNEGKMITGDTLDEVARLSTLIARNPRDYVLYEERAQAQFARDSSEAAMKDIRTAIGLFRNDPLLHYLAGFYALALGDTVTAIAELEASAGLGSVYPETYYQLGQIRFFQNDMVRAELNFGRAAKLDSLAAIYPFAMGYLRLRQGDIVEAENEFQKALDLDPNFPKALIGMHSLYLNQKGDEATAMSYIDRLLETDPGHPEGQFLNGEYHFRTAMRFSGGTDIAAYQDEVNEAVSAFTIALHRDPNYIQAFYNRGYCYFLADNFDPAIADFEAVLSLDSRHAKAAFMLGSIYEHFQDLTTALSYYKIAADADPGFADAQQAVQELESRLRVR